MILKKFSYFIKKTKDKKYTSLLIKWLFKRIQKPSSKNEDIVLQNEFFVGKNNLGDFIILPKSKTGRNLSKSLYQYVLSFEEMEKARENHNKKTKSIKPV